jgi:hypothetical protein
VTVGYSTQSIQAIVPVYLGTSSPTSELVAYEPPFRHPDSKLISASQLTY